MRLTNSVRKTLILKAAVKAIADHGLHAVTNEQIVAECEVETSVSTLRGYYRRRKDLMIALHGAQQTPEELRNQIEEAGYVTG